VTDPIRVVVADDHLLIRQGVRALLGSLEGIEVVGEAADGEEAIAVAKATHPDVVMMDLHMPGTDGVTATRRLVAEMPGIAVLVVTMLDDDASVYSAMKAGARGYLLKGAEQDEILRAVTGVARGEAIFGPGVAGRLLDLLAHSPGATTMPFPELTTREREVLDLLAAGRNNAVIARRLGLSSHTVANHVSNILTKLHASDRTEVIIRARDVGLGG
jgi:DNA-binding NarL/FixJ family response regulator